MKASSACILRVAGMLCASLLVLAPTPHEAAAQQATASAHVAIIAPLRVQSMQPLDFGHVFGTGRPGSITVSPLDATTIEGGARVRPQSNPAAARFLLSGQGGRAYQIVLPASVEAHGVDARGLPAPPLMARAFHAFLVNSGAIATAGTLSAGGNDEAYVGATLDVPAHTRAARYALMVSLVATYN